MIPCVPYTALIKQLSAKFGIELWTIIDIAHATIEREHDQDYFRDVFPTSYKRRRRDF